MYLKWFLTKTFRNQSCESLIKYLIHCEMAYICSEGRNLQGNNDGQNNKPRIRDIYSFDAKTDADYSTSAQIYQTMRQQFNT